MPDGNKADTIEERIDMNITTVNAEQFRGTVFFSLTPRRWGATATVKNPVIYGEYLNQAIAEANAKAAATGATVAEIVAASHITLELDPAALALLRGNSKTKGEKKIKVPKVTKPLLISPAMESLVTFQNETKAKFVGPFGKAMPSHVQEGLYVVRTELVEEFQAQLEEAETKITGELLDALCADYLPAQERARTLPVLEGGLGPLWDAADYPTEAKLRTLFGLEWQWLALGIPEDLPPALRAAAQEKYERQLSEAFEETKAALLASLGGFVDNLVDRLTVQPGEKPKVFRNSMVENIKSFCEVFEAKNIFADDKLTGLVTQARALIASVSPDDLRKFASVKENTRAGFAAIQTAINEALTEQKVRKIDVSLF